MKTIFHIAFLFFLLGNTSCDQKPEQNTETQTIFTPAIFTPSSVTDSIHRENADNNPVFPVATLPGISNLNPEHGQPGHRCDIPVGAQLPTPIQNIQSQPATATAARTTVAPGVNPQHGQPGHRCDIPVGAPLSTPIQNNQSQPATANAAIYTVAPGMNPHHGQPGHRCDIAVGAPLSDTAKKNKSVQANNTVQNKQGNTSLYGVTLPGMNPKHGQPGHRCDIAVGSPLSDTAKIKPVQAGTPVSPTVQNILANPVVDTSSVVAGMNPKHGQPGHRCDIAVGAPLNSKPKQ